MSTPHAIDAPSRRPRRLDGVEGPAASVTPSTRRFQRRPSATGRPRSPRERRRRRRGPTRSARPRSGKRPRPSARKRNASPTRPRRSSRARKPPTRAPRPKRPRSKRRNATPRPPAPRARRPRTRARRPHASGPRGAAARGAFFPLPPVRRCARHVAYLRVSFGGVGVCHVDGVLWPGCALARDDSSKIRASGL